MNHFVADSEAITGLQGTVGSVSADLDNFKSAFSGPSDLAATLGPIAFPFHNAHGDAQSSRDAALGATQVATGRIAELLGQASQAYARGDTDAGDQLKAQADAVGDGHGAGGGASAAGAGAGGAGQMLGQLSQVAGQMGQSVTQPLQGLTQSMSQLPQQVMQGVQGIVETGSQAAGGVDAAGPEHALNAAAHHGPGDSAGAGDDKTPDDKTHDKDSDGKDSKDDHEDPDGKEHDAEDQKRDRPSEPDTRPGSQAEQLGTRATAGVTPQEGYGLGAVPTQIHHINPKRQ